MPSALSPRFGVPLAGVRYRPRPSAYGVVIGVDGRIAVVRTSGGCFLPGGGREPGESAEDALMRECREECGLTVRIVGHIGDAVQFVDAAGEGGLRIEGRFFLARPADGPAVPAEPGHDTLWLPPDAAARAMRRRFEAWAIRRATATRRPRGG